MRKSDALDYHSKGRKGKIEVVTTKSVSTQRDLSLAYSPGVAEPCLEIAKDPAMAYEYTAKGNLVGVISNGSAVLGLGNLGALAGKPVMEGKGVLFKKFADIDVFDIELDSSNIPELVQAIKMMGPTFGGINLEDFKGPECFELEKQLKEQMDIPVFHDDQHGTAIISGSAMINAVELSGKKLEDIKAVYNGAGAAGIACAKFHISLGLKAENVIMCDSKGVIYKGRKEGMNQYKVEFERETDLRTLTEAMNGADMFFGLSRGGVVSQDMVRSMAKNPVILAMANPDAEISYPDAMAAREDVIMATGRSDYPNQVNNVLGFPFIFRGALDVHARQINEEMKRACAIAIADLTKEDVPDSVKHAYGVDDMKFGKEYIIPKPFDPRVLTWVAPAVAKAAMDTGVARREITDLEAYKNELNIRMGRAHEFMSVMSTKAKRSPKKIVFAEGEERKIIRAAEIAVEQEIARPILLGRRSIIGQIAEEFSIDLKGIEIVNPNKDHELRSEFAEEYYRMRNRRGITKAVAERRMRVMPNYFASMMIKKGMADGMIAGLTEYYPQTIRPALEIIGKQDKYEKVSGIYMVIVKNDVYFLSDTTVNVDPSSETLSDITLQAADFANHFDIEPRVAMLSYSNFGSAEGGSPERVRNALKIIKQRRPYLMVDGEMQADTALDSGLLEKEYPFSELKGGANVLIFPNLSSANIAYKLLAKLSGHKLIGPVLQGMNKSVHVLQKGSSVDEIVDMTTIAVVMAGQLEEGQMKI